MAHGTPDWGLVGPISILSGLDDLGEHSVRAGAVSSWDRRGHVIFSDDFREGLGAWYLQVSDPTAIICPFTGHALSQPYCVKLVNGTAGARYARINKYFGYGYRGACGLEFNVTLEPGTVWLKFGFASHLATGRRFFYVRFTPGTGDVAHGTDAVGWTPFGNVGAVADNIWEWHNVKLVADFNTGFFVKLVWEGAVTDMAGIPARDLAAAASRRWRVFIENDEAAAAAHQVYVDDVIVTIDEP